MKKIFVIPAITTIILASCQRELEFKPTEQGQEQNNEITLSVPGASLSKVANQGIRVTYFQTGDQISVTAINATETYDGSQSFTNHWEQEPYFQNEAAAYQSNNATDLPSAGGEISYFAWGNDGSGGVNTQYYPSAGKYISLFAYYPHADVANGLKYTELNTAGGTDTEKQPKLEIEIFDDNTVVEDLTLLAPYFAQPDVLYYASTKSVNRENITPPLEFQHALAQIRFTVRLAEGASDKFFRKIIFKTVKNGTMNLATGGFEYDAIPEYTEAVFTITMPENAVSNGQLPKFDQNPLDVVNPTDESNFNYPMILPLEANAIQNGVLELYLSDKIDTPIEEADIITVNLTNFSNNFEAGKQNTIALRVTGTEISLEATIADWGIGDTTDLDAE